MSRGSGAGWSRVVVAFDCATDATAVALLEPNDAGSGLRVVGSLRDESGARHGGGVLLPLVQRLLEEAGFAQEDIGALVVGTGPGTFTGVRIAVSTGRALALALGVPVFGVRTLDAIAAQAIQDLEAAGSDPERATLVPLVDARRGQVFTAAYVRTEEGWRSGRLFAAAPEEVVTQVRAGQGRVDVVCAGAEVLVGRCHAAREDAIIESGGEDADVVAGVTSMPRVLDAAFLVLGQERLDGGAQLGSDLLKACASAGIGPVVPPRAGGAASPELVTPIYVRPPDADIHITKMKDPWGGR